MFIKAKNGNFVNILLASEVKLFAPGLEGASWVVSARFNYENNDFRIIGKGESRIAVDLYTGTKEQCQAYMVELEKELAAFGKLIRVEVD